MAAARAGSISSLGSPTDKPADGVAVELQGGGQGCLFRPEVGRHPALDDPEQALTGPLVGGSGPGGPGQGPFGRQADLFLRRRETGADVERHLDVGAQALLEGDRQLGGQAVQGAVVGRTERDPVVVDPGAEREHLESPGVGQQVPVPAGEAMQSANRLDHLDARTQHQVVGVGQDDLRPEGVQVAGIEEADRAARARRA